MLNLGKYIVYSAVQVMELVAKNQNISKRSVNFNVPHSVIFGDLETGVNIVNFYNARFNHGMITIIIYMLSFDPFLHYVSTRSDLGIYIFLKKYRCSFFFVILEFLCI